MVNWGGWIFSFGTGGSRAPGGGGGAGIPGGGGGGGGGGGANEMWSTPTVGVSEDNDVFLGSSL